MIQVHSGTWSSTRSADWCIRVNWMCECFQREGLNDMLRTIVTTNTGIIRIRIKSTIFGRCTTSSKQLMYITFEIFHPQSSRDTSRHPSWTSSIWDESCDDDRLRPFSEASGRVSLVKRTVMNLRANRQILGHCTTADFTALATPVRETEDSRGEVSTIDKDELDIPSRSPENDVQRFHEELHASPLWSEKETSTST